MNETIGEIGGHNDQKRRIRIKRAQRKKLDEYEEERERSMSDDCVMLSLKDEFGITDGQQIQKLSNEERDVILAALLRRYAGVRQLQRLTGIGKNIISNVSKKLY